MTDQEVINGLKIGVLNAIIRYQNSEYATKIISATKKSNSAVIKIPSNNLKKRVDSVNREYKKKQLIKQSKSTVTKCLIKMYDYEKFELEYFDLRFDLYAKKLDTKKERFIKKYPGFEEKDFLKSEINYFENPESNRYFFNSKNHKIFYHIHLENDTHILDLHKNKKIDFLKEKLQIKPEQERENIEAIQSQPGKQKIENKGFPDIFKSYECYNDFKNIMDYLEINLSFIDDRNNQAKFMAIWKNASTRKFFKQSKLKKDYCEFLNKKYKTNYNSRSSSQPYTYTPIIDEYYSLK